MTTINCDCVATAAAVAAAAAAAVAAATAGTAAAAAAAAAAAVAAAAAGTAGTSWGDAIASSQSCLPAYFSAHPFRLLTPASLPAAIAPNTVDRNHCCHVFVPRNW